MADMLQDLYGLQYSPSFTIEGQQEADVNLSLPPRTQYPGLGLRYGYRRCRPHCRRHRQALRQRRAPLPAYRP